MEDGQPFQRDVSATNNHRIAGGDAISAGRAAPWLRGTDGIRSRQLVLRRPTSSSTQRSSPSSVAGSMYVYPSIREAGTSLGYMLSTFPSPTAPSYESNLPTEIQDQRDRSGHRQDHFNGLSLSPRTFVGRSQGFPSVALSPGPAGDHFNTGVTEYQHSNREQTAFRTPEPPFPLWDRGSGLDAAPINRVFTSGDGGTQNQHKAMNEPDTFVLRGSYLHDTSFNLPTSRRFLCEVPGDESGSYEEGPFRHGQTRSPDTRALSQSGEGAINIPEHVGPSSIHRLCDERIANEEQFGAVPPQFPPIVTPSRPMGGVQPSGRTRKAEEEIKDPPRGKLTPRGNLKDLEAFPAQVPETSIGARGTTHLVEVPQTRYKCRNRQESWEEVGPIEFGYIRVTDALDRDRLGLPGPGEYVLNYEGVGSTISCRINFAGRDIGKPCKILTTNNKTPREPTTNKKLAYEVARFVVCHINTIKDQPDCAGITLDNLVLARLVRVSKASWQPVLYYEPPISRCDGS